MNALGLYFGPKAITIVESKGKKVIHNILIPQTTFSPGELEEKVPSDVKLIEIIALIKDELRRNKIETRDVSLCLSGKDLIIRSFEMPLLPKEELKSAINFEAKKYIPFKVEDMITDFQLKFEKESRINLVLFMGVKKETFERYVSILRQLDMRMVSVEYSAFGILRALKLARLSEKGVYGVLGVDVAGEDEINFSVLEDGFPLFSRDIVLATGQQAQAPAEEVLGTSQALEKLKTEIRVSLGYYHRKFPTKNIKNIYLLCNNEFRTDLEAYMSEIGVGVSFVDVTRQIDKTLPYSLSFIKAFSASLSRAVKSNIKIDLLGEGEKTVKVKESRFDVSSFLKGLELDLKVVSAGILICAATFLYGIYRATPIRNELSRIMAMRVKVSSVQSDVSYAELQEIDSRFNNKLANFDKLIKKQLYLTIPLDVIPRVLPKGSWLTQLTFMNKEDGGSELVFAGKVYLGDGSKEFEAVNEIIAKLKDNQNFNRYFKDISINSVSREQSGSMASTVFSITCKERKGAN